MGDFAGEIAGAATCLFIRKPKAHMAKIKLPFGFQNDGVATKRCDDITKRFGPSNFENCTSKVHLEIAAIQNKVSMKLRT